MKRNLYILTFLSIVFLSSTAFVVMTSSGIAGQTGSPGEGTCSGCHSGGGGVTTVSFSAVPSFTSNQYLPGQTYTVTVTVANANFSRFGFGCEILTPANANAGSMTTALTGVKFLNSGARKNAVQTTAKLGTGSADFSFVWVAPTSGTATIYAAGNAVNGTGSTSGDKVGSASLALTPDLSAGISEPVASGFAGISIYPNPVISDLKMNYSLTEAGDVNISITDLQGKEVAEIKNENQQHGFHSVTATIPASVSKGVYFVRLSLNKKTSTQRLIVIQ
jgi:hypothetical protein